MNREGSTKRRGGKRSFVAESGPVRCLPPRALSPAQFPPTIEKTNLPFSSKPMRSALLLLPFAFLLVSCGNLQNLANKASAKRQQKAMEKLKETSSEEAAARLGATALGEVASVREGGEYVLIRTLAGVRIPADAGLESRHEGKRTALLRSTPERNNTFATADVLEGTPQPGDGVFPSTAKPKPSPPVRPTIAPAPAPAPNRPAVETAAPAPALPGEESAPAVPAGVEDDFDPTNLPAFKEAVAVPQDLKNR